MLGFNRVDSQGGRGDVAGGEGVQITYGDATADGGQAVLLGSNGTITPENPAP